MRHVMFGFFALCASLAMMSCGNAIIATTDPISGITNLEYARMLPLTYAGESTGELLSFFSSQSYQNPEYSMNVSYSSLGDSARAFMTLCYEAQDWMFIDGIDILVNNGTCYHYRDEDPYRDVHRGGVTELTVYAIPWSIMGAICNGSVRTIRASGDHLYTDLTIPSSTQTLLSSFWDNLVAKHPEIAEESAVIATPDTLQEFHLGRRVSR